MIENTDISAYRVDNIYDALRDFLITRCADYIINVNLPTAECHRRWDNLYDFVKHLIPFDSVVKLDAAPYTFDVYAPIKSGGQKSGLTTGEIVEQITRCATQYDVIVINTLGLREDIEHFIIDMYRDVIKKLNYFLSITDELKDILNVYLIFQSDFNMYKHKIGNIIRTLGHPYDKYTLLELIDTVNDSKVVTTLKNALTINDMLIELQLDIDENKQRIAEIKELLASSDIRYSDKLLDVINDFDNTSIDDILARIDDIQAFATYDTCYLN